MYTDIYNGCGYSYTFLNAENPRGRRGLGLVGGAGIGGRVRELVGEGGDRWELVGEGGNVS